MTITKRTELTEQMIEAFRADARYGRMELYGQVMPDGRLTICGDLEMLMIGSGYYENLGRDWNFSFVTCPAEGFSEAPEILNRLMEHVYNAALRDAATSNEVQQSLGFNAHEAVMALGVLASAREYLLTGRGIGLRHAAWLQADIYEGGSL